MHLGMAAALIVAVLLPASLVHQAQAGAVPPRAALSCASPSSTPPAPPAPAALPRGVVSVLAFGADPTGRNDSTAALQAALTAARTTNTTIFLDRGCYRVTDTLNATEPRNGRWQPVVVVGAATTDRTSTHPVRPTLFLADSTPGFAGQYQHRTRPVIRFWTNWCLSPGPAPAAAPADCKGGVAEDRAFPPYQFNQVLQGVDVVVGSGNPAAVGITMLGAQGSTLQNVAVYAAPDAAAGVNGGNGGGGSFVGLRVVGARYGIDMREVQSSPTLAGVDLINQTCAGILLGGGLGSSFRHGKAPLTATALRVQGSPLLGGALAGIDQADFAAHAPQCVTGLGPLLHGRQPPPGHPATRPAASNNPVKYLMDGMGLVDSVIAVTGGAPCIRANSSLYVSDVFVSGCPEAMVVGGRSPVPSGSTSPRDFARISLAAFGREAGPIGPAAPYTYRFPVYRNGTRSEAGFADVSPPGWSAPPDWFTARHVWAGSGVTWQSPGAFHVLQHGARGDGVADDWAAIQGALDAHDVVVLGKGFYRLSRPLRMRRPNGALVGVGRTLCFLMQMSAGLAGGDPHREAGEGEPLLDVTADGATLGMVTLVTWDHLPGFALRWAGGDGVFRQVFANRMREGAFPPFSALAVSPAGPPRPATPIAVPLLVVSGSGAFYDLNLDFGCCFGTLLPGGNVTVNPAIASSAEILLQHGGYRTLLVNGSTAGLRFYAHNTEQDVGDAHTEIRWSHNVTLYGAKAEGNYVAVWVRDSDLITVHGYGGDATAFSNATRYAPGRAQFMPSLFRVQRSTRVRLANLVDSGRWTTPSRPSTLVAAGNGTDPRAWNMVLRQDSDAVCDPNQDPSACAATRALDRPVLWEI